MHVHGHKCPYYYEFNSQIGRYSVKRDAEMEAGGLIERHPYSQKPLRHEYRLTEKGRAFYPVIYALRAWGETWSKGEEEEIAVRFTHRECGHDIGLGSVCPNCGVHVERKDLEAKMSEQFAAEREQRWVAYKGK